MRGERAMNAHHIERIVDPALALGPAPGRLSAFSGAGETLRRGVEPLADVAGIGSQRNFAFFHRTSSAQRAPGEVQNELVASPESRAGTELRGTRTSGGAWP
jgi:hypothetical protein